MPATTMEVVTTGRPGCVRAKDPAQGLFSYGHWNANVFDEVLELQMAPVGDLEEREEADDAI